MKPAPVPFFAASLAQPLTVRTQIRAGLVSELKRKSLSESDAKK